jgi:hypothetical protein
MRGIFGRKGREVRKDEESDTRKFPIFTGHLMLAEKS